MPRLLRASALLVTAVAASTLCAAPATAAAPAAVPATAGPAAAASAAPATAPAATPALVAPAPRRSALTTPDLDLGAAPAVTHGTAVKKPSKQVPWALSLWNEPKDKPNKTGSGRFGFVCSATAIGPRVILTAAHCVKGMGYLYVQVGADKLKQKTTLVPVEAMVSHKKYSKRTSKNDVALLRPLFDLELASYAKLATPSLMAKVRTGRAPLTIYGWGNNEKRKLTGSLRTASLRVADRAAAVMLRDFEKKSMVAAGRLNTRTGKWSGGCNGDSGGPLTTKVGKKVYVVGVSGFVSIRGCDTAPTVFASVGFHKAWAAVQTRALPAVARKQNTALPVALSAPTVAGAVVLGQTVTCAPGAWSPNVTRVTSGWYRDSTYLGDGADHVMVTEDAGRELECVSFANSKAGIASYGAEVVKVPVKPTSTGFAEITGRTGFDMPPVGTVLTCSGVTPGEGATAVTYQWFVGTGFDATGAAPLPVTTPTITLDVPTLQAAAGKRLVCQVVVSGPMGSTASADTESVPALEVRAGSVDVTLNTRPAAVGSVATCAAPKAPADGVVSYRWARTDSLQFGDTFPVGAVPLPSTTAQHVLTPSDLGKYVACEVTVTTWQGVDTQVGSARAA